jgi:hypothetical protein
MLADFVTAPWGKRVVVKFKSDHDQERGPEAEDQTRNVRPFEARKGPRPFISTGRSLWQAPKGPWNALYLTKYLTT